MNSSFFKFAIVCTIVGFFLAITDPFFVLLTRKSVLTGWPFFIVGTSLSVCSVYIAYKFYFFKNVRFLFFLNLVAIGINILSYTQILRMTLDPAFTYNFSTLIRLASIIGLLSSAYIFTTHLTKENLFLILAIGGLITCLVGLLAEIFRLYFWLGINYFVQVTFQLIWILIFYKEMKPGTDDDVLDQN